MKTTFKNLIILIIAIFLVAGFFLLFNNPKKSAKIISANFVGFDFARAITGSDKNIEMLMAPGIEAHSYDPTPADIIAIKNADLFIYNGGESDAWVDRILTSNNIPEEKTLRLMDFVSLKEEATEGMESEEHSHESEDHEHEEGPEYDEHIWTSLKNSIKLVKAIRDKLTSLYPDQAGSYTKNTDAYISRLNNLDEAIANVVKNTTSPTLIFGDRFPFRYFVDDYGLDYYAAFPGCSDQVEASASTIAFLIDKSKEINAKVIFKIELTSDKLARTIAEESDAKVLELHSAHNISSDDFKNGITFADLMERNLAALKEALN